MKGDLASATIDISTKTGRKLTRDDLRQLFKPPSATNDCETRLLLQGSDHQPLSWLDMQGGRLASGAGEQVGCDAALVSALTLGVVTAVGKVLKGADAAAAKEEEGGGSEGEEGKEGEEEGGGLGDGGAGEDGSSSGGGADSGSGSGGESDGSASDDNV